MRIRVCRTSASETTIVMYKHTVNILFEQGMSFSLEAYLRMLRMQPNLQSAFLQLLMSKLPLCARIRIYYP